MAFCSRRSVKHIYTDISFTSHAELGILGTGTDTDLSDRLSVPANLLYPHAALNYSHYYWNHSDQKRNVILVFTSLPMIEKRKALSFAVCHPAVFSITEIIPSSSVDTETTQQILGMTRTAHCPEGIFVLY